MVFNWRRDFRFGFCYLGYRVGLGDLFDGGFGDGFGGFDFGGEVWVGCNIYRVGFDGGEARLWVGVIGPDGSGYGFDRVENGGAEDGR